MESSQKSNAPTQIDTTRQQSANDPGHAGKLPHEHDQSVHSTDQKPDAQMQQAYQDVKKGLIDTDARDANGKPLGSQRPAG